MKILMVVAYFIPEVGSAAHIYFDLAKAFVSNGHEVDVITSYPREFNLDGSDLNKKFSVEETIDGIKVHRCKYHLLTRDNVILRGLEHFLLPRIYFNMYKKLNKKFDVCLIYIPPLAFYNFAKKIKDFNGTPSVLHYQDFHPQELIDVGMVKNKILIKILENLERESYKNADHMISLSEKGIEFIVERGGNPDKITHIYNSVNPSGFDLYAQKKDFKIKENIGDRILVSYCGILSPFQGVDNFLDASKRLIEHKELMFYIVGGGMTKNHLSNRIQKENISNVKIMPLQSRNEYFNIINSSDISIVSLDKRMTAPCLPGKLINLLGVGQLIIANVPLDSETAYVIKKAKCGIVVEPGNVDELAKAIIKLKDDPELRKELGNNGRIFLEENMNLEKNIEKYEKIFKSLI